MAKLLICSDIHGDADTAKAVLEAFDKSGAERIVILGDILYHGPRNNLPGEYAPKEVAEMLNKIKNHANGTNINIDDAVAIGLINNYSIDFFYDWMY